MDFFLVNDRCAVNLANVSDAFYLPRTSNERSSLKVVYKVGGSFIKTFHGQDADRLWNEIRAKARQ